VLAVRWSEQGTAGAPSIARGPLTHFGSSRNLGAKEPTTAVGDSTRLATSASSSAVEASGTTPEGTQRGECGAPLLFWMLSRKNAGLQRDMQACSAGDWCPAVTSTDCVPPAAAAAAVTAPQMSRLRWATLRVMRP
jgi:hypothetical protein